jgi:hypothetical protein
MFPTLSDISSEKQQGYYPRVVPSAPPCPCTSSKLILFPIHLLKRLRGLAPIHSFAVNSENGAFIIRKPVIPHCATI